MTYIHLQDVGFPLLLNKETADNAIKYINTLDLNQTTIIDLRGCSFSYDISLFFDALVHKLCNKKIKKSLIIKHGLATVSGNHFAMYINKKKSSIYYNEQQLENIKKVILEHYNVDLIIEQVKDEQ